MNQLYEFGHNILKSQPFSQLLGTQLTLFENEKAELRLPVRQELTQQHGFVHGGVISYLADNCLTYAGGSVLGDSVTSEYKINYVRPAIGHTLIARSTVLSCGKRQAICECKVTVTNEEGEKLIAVAQGTIVKV